MRTHPWFILALTLHTLVVMADPPRAWGEEITANDATLRARNEYNAGAAFAESAQWGEALGAFERSSALRAHALTTYNIGACERALGRYTRARRTLLGALDQNAAASGKELPATYDEEAHVYLAEFDKLLVRLAVTVDPSDATFVVDGRPIAPDVAARETPAPTKATVPVMVAGVTPPGGGAKLPAARFDLLLDPGTHVFAITHRGFSDAAVNKTYAPGTRETLVLELAKLPARIHVESDRAGATVSLAGLDVGVTPVDLSRPAGTYELVVRSPGYVTYRSRIDVAAGAESRLNARLSPEITPLTKKWWFWTIAGVVVTGAVIGTYAATRPAPQRPPLDGGGLGWAVNVP